MDTAKEIASLPKGEKRKALQDAFMNAKPGRAARRRLEAMLRQKEKRDAAKSRAT